MHYYFPRRSGIIMDFALALNRKFDFHEFSNKGRIICDSPNLTPFRASLDPHHETVVLETAVILAGQELLDECREDFPITVGAKNGSVIIPIDMTTIRMEAKAPHPNAELRVGPNVATVPLLGESKRKPAAGSEKIELPDDAALVEIVLNAFFPLKNLDNLSLVGCLNSSGKSFEQSFVVRKLAVENFREDTRDVVSVLGLRGVMRNHGNLLFWWSGMDDRM